MATSAEPAPTHESYLEELDGYRFEDIEVGMTAVYSRTITESDIVLFCGISGDTNPVHLDETYAGKTLFRGTIAHGMLPASFISTILGTKLPGPGTIYVSQNCRFRAPVRAGDTVHARATVTAIDEKRRRVTLKTDCFVGKTCVIEGDAEVMVPARD